MPFINTPLIISFWQAAVIWILKWFLISRVCHSIAESNSFGYTGKTNGSESNTCLRMDPVQWGGELISYLSTTAPVRLWLGLIKLPAEQRQPCQTARKPTGLQNFSARTSSHLYCTKEEASCGTGLRDKRQRVQKNKSSLMRVWEDRAVAVVRWEEHEGRGIIELQWPNDSTIGEVMCWINSVPDPIFGGAVPLGRP